jgi:hypothetical protein
MLSAWALLPKAACCEIGFAKARGGNANWRE